MADTTNLNIRIDRELKSEADFILSKMGMNLSTAVNVFIRQVVQEKAIPFKVQISDNTLKTQENARERMREAFKTAQAESIKNGTDKMTMEEIDAEIASCRKESGTDSA